MFVALPALIKLELANYLPKRDKHLCKSLTDTHSKTKLDAITALLEEMHADGVTLAPGLTAQEILYAEEAGLVMDLEVGMISGTENARYAIIDKGRHAL